MSLRIWMFLILLSLVWGGSFFFTEVALIDVPTFTLVFLRVFIAALFLFSYLKIIEIMLKIYTKKLFLLNKVWEKVLLFQHTSPTWSESKRKMNEKADTTANNNGKLTHLCLCKFSFYIFFYGLKFSYCYFWNDVGI